MAKLIHTDKTTKARVFFDSVWEEYYVVEAGKGKGEGSTYYTTDKQDAMGTAAQFTRQWQE